MRVTGHQHPPKVATGALFNHHPQQLLRESSPAMIGDHEHVTQVRIAHSIGYCASAADHGAARPVVDADYSPRLAPLTFDVVAASPRVPIRLRREEVPDNVDIDSR